MEWEVGVAIGSAFVGGMGLAVGGASNGHGLSGGEGSQDYTLFLEFSMFLLMNTQNLFYM